MTGETWADIPGYEGIYRVSNMGRVRSLPRKKRGFKGVHYFYPGRLLKASPDSYGYLVVGLCRGDGKMRTRKVHQLVAQAFVPNPKELPVAHHRNKNKKDNRASNLRWASFSAHSRHHHKTDGYSVGSKNGNARLVEADVVKIRQRLAAGEFQKDVAADYRISQTMVSLIKRRKFWTHC